MIDNHIEITDMFVIKLSHYLVILEISWLQSHNLYVHWRVNILIFNSLHCLNQCLTALKLIIVYELSVISEFLLLYVYLSAKVLLTILLDMKILENSLLTSLNVAAIEAASFNLWTKCYLIKVFTESLRNIEKTLKLKKHIDSAVKLLKKYHQFLDIFSRKKADTLSVHWSYNHKILLEDEKQLMFKTLYRIS